MLVIRIASGVASHFIMRLPEWGNSLTMLFFGLTLLERGDTFDNPQFAVMAHYANEGTWGWLLVTLAGLRLVALVINGTFDGMYIWTLRLRAIGATLCCFGWFCLSLGLFFGPPNTGWKTYGVHLAVDMILAIYLGGKAGRVERGRRVGST